MEELSLETEASVSWEINPKHPLPGLWRIRTFFSAHTFKLQAKSGISYTKGCHGKVRKEKIVV